ncbi:DinB family protein [bacterium SCSIO 12696]|nr:DinB family protein [bacterium SCSIO 12696]
MQNDPQQNILVDQNILILHSLRTIISQLDDTVYTATHDTFYSSSIGAHTRHILDHYLMFLAGVEGGTVDYDKRCRDPEIETNRDHARATIGRIIDGLKHLPSNDTPINAAIKVTIEGTTPVQASTVGRELIFLHGHTTHHHSLMALILRLQDTPVDTNFGYAPSTLKYRSEQVCAR